MKILIVAAKTGGHVFPAAATGEQFFRNKHEIIFLGIGNDIERNAFEKINSKYYQISIDGFRGQNIFKKIHALFKALTNTFKVINIINKEKIDAMIGFGGFVTIPAGFACWLKRKPIFIHEQNAVMGTANKLLEKVAKIRFLGFPISNKPVNLDYILSGNPIRESFLKYSNNKNNITKEKVKIYITGGSQGSEFINTNIPKIFNTLKINVDIKHQCGRNNIDEVSNLYKQEKVEAEILEFYKNPNEQIIWSDFVISRAGALSLSEIISLNRGTVMIPLPTSVDNHQVENAKYIESENMGIMHQEKDGLDALLKGINQIIANKIYLDWQKKSIKFNHLNASKIILEHVESFVDETI